MNNIDDQSQAIIQGLYKKDRFSKWLDINITEISAGQCTCSMVVREEMLNGFGILHGGVTFAMADSVLAFAANSYGRLSVALRGSISFVRQVRVGELLVAKAKEEYIGSRTGLYRIDINNEKGETVAFFDGTVYRTNQQINEREQSKLPK